MSRWQESLMYEIRDDHHVSGKYGFELRDSNNDWVLFESGIVYSTRDDAEQAAQDAAHAAWLWRNR